MKQSEFRLFAQSGSYYCSVCHEPVLGDIWIHTSSDIYCTRCMRAKLDGEAKLGVEEETVHYCCVRCRRSAELTLEGLRQRGGWMHCKQCGWSTCVGIPPSPPPPATDVHIYPTKPKVYCLDCEHCCLYWRLGDPDSYKHISLGEEEYIQKRLAGARCRAVCAEEQGPMYHWSVPAKCIEVNAHNDCTKFERREEKAEKVR